MPLARVQVRNEYGLGRPELYKRTNREDPKAVLDAVVVAGLVGILRQLGDLADFAAEVFHGLQEQVLTTASRSHKLMLRAQNIEASLPPLEKAILAQTGHIHFAYTAGCDWHSRAKNEQNHFIYNDLPQFIMDSYEECRDPPRLHLLDKFDPGGPGSCLRRYSDPTFFKRVSADSDEILIKKTERSRKTSRSKKKRSSRRNGETLQGEQMHSNGGRRTSSSQTADDVVLESDLEDHSYSVDSRADVGHRKSLSRRNGETLKGEQMHSNDRRMQFASHDNGQTSSSQTADVVVESDLEDHSYSVDSRADPGYIECAFQPSNSVQFGEQECKESPSSRLTQKKDALRSTSPTIDYNFSQGSFGKQIASTSTGLTWDEKEEMVDSESQWCDRDEILEAPDETQNLHMHEDEPVSPENSDQVDFLYGEERNLKPVSSRVQTDETDSEPDDYMDALNTIESESENDLDCETKQEAEQFTSNVSPEVMENGVGAISTVIEQDFYNVFSHTISSVSLNKETDLDFPETLQEIPHIPERCVTSLSNSDQSDDPDNMERTLIFFTSYDSGSPINEPVPDTCGNSVLDCSVGVNPLDDTCSLNDTVSTSIKTIPSNVPVNIESKRNLVDSHGSDSPNHEQELHQPVNYVLDCSLGNNPLGDGHIICDAVSVSIEPVQSNVIVNRERTESLSDAPEYPIGEQVPHICGTSIFDNAHNDSLSASSENVRLDGGVNSETTKNLANTHAPQNPIHEQVSHVCSVFDNAHNGSLSACIENVRSDGVVNSETIKNLADTHAPQSPIHGRVSHACSVFDNAHNDSLSASTENVRPAGVVYSENTKNLADTHALQSPIHEQVSHVCSGFNNAHNDSLSACIENVRPDGVVNSETIKNLADTHAPQSPIHGRVSHACFVFDNAHNDSLSASTENVRPAGVVYSENTKNLADTHALQSPIHEQVSHVCSVFDNAHNDSLSASIENVQPDGVVNSETIKNLADTHAPQSPTHGRVSHACSVFDNAHDDSLSASTENVRPAGVVYSENTKNLAYTHALQSPIHEQVSHVCSVFDNAHNDSLSASIENVRPDVVNSETIKNLADTHAPQSPTHGRVSHACSVFDNAHDGSLSASTGNVRPDSSVNSETIKNLSDTHAPQSPIHEQVSHVCSVFDNAHNDSLSASRENVRPDVFVNSETTKNLADTHAPQSPIHEQVSHVCGNSVLECFIGTNPLGDYPTLNDSVSASTEIDPSDDPVNFERTMSLADAHGSVSTIHEELPHICGDSVLNCLGGTNPLGDAHTLHDTVSAIIETDTSSGSKSSDLPDKEVDNIDNNLSKSKETLTEPASDPSVGLWTNGGLLGLEPSKPPDFIMPSSFNQGFMTSTNDKDGVSNLNSIKSNGYREEPELSKIAELNQKEPSFRCLVSQCDDQPCISGKTSDSHWESSRHGQNDEGFDKKVPTPGTVVPVAHTGCTEPIKGGGLNSPLLFGLGHKLLMNSFYRRVSLDERSGPDNSVKTGLLEQSGQNSTVQQSLPGTTFKEQLSYDRPICSPPPSPPLEHMKISFCPVDGFETFKLKLKLPDVGNHSESTSDMFPSFWLVPEPSILVHDSGSNSDDDDTFCRSVSDDCLSPHSDYNSDQWESDDTPDISGDGVYDSSHRISLIESKSSSQGVTNVDINLDSEHIMLSQDSVEPSLSGNLLNFPSFDTMNPFLGKECNRHSDYDDNLKLQSHAESIQPAPPLPPNQWRLSNQRSDIMNEEQNCMSKDTEPINDPTISESTLQVRPTAVKQNPTDHEDHELNEDIIPRKLLDKSFNQNHTVTGKPNNITSPTTSDKVGAILEKANAIRQVISCDDDEDDDDDDDDDDRWSEI